MSKGRRKVGSPLHEPFMGRALELAARGLGRTSPNPVVGAVLVREGRIVGEGYHRKAGLAHAEVLALREAGALAKGSTLFTTLEPCDHHGRTPPCSLAIMEAGVKSVVFASEDPNPLVQGRGVRRLRRADVSVTGGVLRERADRLNRPFFKLIRTGMPFVLLKAAVTLDGKLASRTGESKWISGEEARAWVHERRNEADAILVGSSTVRADNPRLTTRLAHGRGRDAARVVMDSKLGLKPTLHVFAPGARVIVATTRDGSSRAAGRLEAKGAEVWRLPRGSGGVDLRALLQRLGGEGFSSVMVEGGASLFASFIRDGLADELALFMAPKFLGASGLSWVGELEISRMRDAIAAGVLEVQKVGEDVLIQGEL